jgi:nicotinamidase-related amidase
MLAKPSNRDLLLIVDVQSDFLPGGAPGAELTSALSINDAGVARATSSEFLA